MEIDAEKKILDWCGHLSVPRWDDEKSYNACHGCSAKMDGMFGKGKHHCRLCGRMFCSACTAKYHVPLIFRQAVKNKEGPARVCMSCVDGCLKEKEKASSPAGANGSSSAFASPSSGSSLVSSSLTSMGARAVEIAPPAAWEEESAFVCCPKCSATKGHTHNCRVCGLLYCDKCTSKMDIPACFERKKHKSGPTRVCDSCRFKIKSGAKLVERISGAPGPGASKGPPPPPAGFLGQQRRPSSFASRCTAPGCTNATAAADGKCATHTSIKGAAAESESRTTVVKRESDGSTVATLHVPSGDTPLSTIDVLLKKTAPQGEGYCYVFRGATIPEAFFTVFLARHLGNTLLIRPKASSALGGGPLEALREEDESEANGSGGVDAHNNPFKRDVAKEAALAAERAERSRPKPKKAVLVFKRPATISKRAGLLAGPPPVPAAQGGKKVPPPPPPPSSKPKPPPVPGSASAPAAAASSSSASALGAGGIDAALKHRAKTLFGQL